MAVEMHLPAGINASSERFRGVMQEGGPADRETWRRLTYDADSVIPQILFTPELACEIVLGFRKQRFELRNGDTQEAGAAQDLESVVRVLADQEAVQLCQDTFATNAQETLSLLLHGLLSLPIEAKAELGDESSGPE